MSLINLSASQLPYTYWDNIYSSYRSGFGFNLLVGVQQKLSTSVMTLSCQHLSTFTFESNCSFCSYICLLWKAVGFLEDIERADLNQENGEFKTIKPRRLSVVTCACTSLSTRAARAPWKCPGSGWRYLRNSQCDILSLVIMQREQVCWEVLGFGDYLQCGCNCCMTAHLRWGCFHPETVSSGQVGSRSVWHGFLRLEVKIQLKFNDDNKPLWNTENSGTSLPLTTYSRKYIYFFQIHLVGCWGRFIQVVSFFFPCS